MLFALVRIPLDFTRAYEADTAFLTIGGQVIVESQLSSLAIALFSSLMLLRLRRESSTPSAA